MNLSSRTTEGLPNECPVCGKKVWIEPSVPPGDAVCPHCGNLLWFADVVRPLTDIARRLSELGAVIETDDQGEVRHVQFSGNRYNDLIVPYLAALTSVKSIDLRDTEVTVEGARRLRVLLPNTRIEY